MSKHMIMNYGDMVYHQTYTVINKLSFAIEC